MRIELKTRIVVDFPDEALKLSDETPIYSELVKKSLVLAAAVNAMENTYRGLLVENPDFQVAEVTGARVLLEGESDD